MMNRKKFFLATVLLSFIALMAAGIAKADTIHGELWYSSKLGSLVSNAAVNPTPTNAAKITRTADITFTVKSLNFNLQSGNSSTTYTDWLNSKVPNNVSLLTGTDHRFVTGSKNGNMYGTFMEFTGTSYFTPSQNLTVYSDDGFSLTIGKNFSFTTDAKPQSVGTGDSVTLPSSFHAGYYNYTFYYGAVNGFPEVFQVVPEPSTLLLSGIVLLGFGLVGFKRKQDA